jgi:hypothetical protein
MPPDFWTAIHRPEGKMNTNNVLAGSLIGVALVCATVLTAIGKLPVDVLTHALVAVFSGGLALLQPSAIATPATAPKAP